MNKKMKMLIICAVFALMISCKNYASGEDVKSLEQEKDLKEKIKGFLETKKEEFFGDFEKPVVEVKPKDEESMQADEWSQGHAEEQVVQGVAEDLELKEIEEQIKELKEKIEKSDGKTTIGTYCEYEKEIKDLREKLKDKEEFKNQLETLEKILKDKIEKRKKELEEVKEKLENLKRQVDTTVGITQGDQAREQGKIGMQAWQYAQKLGLNGNYSTNNGSDTTNLTKETIENALQKIEEELNNTKEDAIRNKQE
ncbi:hypothetical protein [Borreliella burgdorferi]|uniref:hypothetical protein n=1 Tax=Borreliella burgdorferi TaxID=139 RepID=UPI00017F3853|nr:hypothetical protein [Borreliella burgdorferi]ACN55515.1 conserved hypothetical protein [Borreliella burgdorferi WI91-23]ATH10603.1 hypothetical protein BHT49_05345 [Borreliella burgdorferi]PRQ93695.1 hypothetical protein CV684_06135 [Borreliella burgdorferi]PRQ96983.1 hypothetical protein CV674_06330 [Borreliella burgdorferi]PRR23351.1 hypothetical protein CV641_06255 [Borreliella burgdorferi]